MALFVKLDVNWPDDPRVIEAGFDGSGLHATILCLGKRLDRDGWVPLTTILRRYGAPQELVDRLVATGLCELEDGKVRSAGWEDANPSVEERSRKAREAGRRGNHVKHNHLGDFSECRICRNDLATSEDLRDEFSLVRDSPSQQRDEFSLEQSKSREEPERETRVVDNSSGSLRAKGVGFAARGNPADLTVAAAAALYARNEAKRNGEACPACSGAGVRLVEGQDVAVRCECSVRQIVRPGFRGSRT